VEEGEHRNYLGDRHCCKHLEVVRSVVGTDKDEMPSLEVEHLEEEHRNHLDLEEVVEEDSCSFHDLYGIADLDTPLSSTSTQDRKIEEVDISRD
jgi:hypothetical protein